MPIGTGSAGAHNTVTVGTSAVIVRAGATGRDGLIVQSLSTNTGVVYLGSSSGVTTANGIELKAGASMDLSQYNGDVYAIASLAGQDVRYMAAT